jgi:hypothetical protein
MWERMTSPSALVCSRLESGWLSVQGYVHDPEMLHLLSELDLGTDWRQLQLAHLVACRRDLFTYEVRRILIVRINPVNVRVIA